MLRLHFITTLVLLLTACAQAQTSPETESPPVEASALDNELFYRILLGELNAQGGDPGSAYSLLLDAARRTGDARLYKRATDIALQARAGESALHAVREWQHAHPESAEANHYHLQILIRLNRIKETLAPLQRKLELTPEAERAATIIRLPRYFQLVTDKKLAAQVLEEALAAYRERADTRTSAWIAMGQARLQAGLSASALAAARNAHKTAPDDSAVALLAIALVDAGESQADALLQRYLDGSPDMNVRMAYVRALLNTQRYAQANTQVRLITRNHPDQPQAWLIQGTLELQDNRYDDAEVSFQRYVALEAPTGTEPTTEQQNRGLAQAYLSLSRIAEERKDFVAAEQWLSRITSREDLVRAQSRRATLLARQGRVDDARRLLHELPERTPADARLKLMAEVQLLRDSRMYKPAHALLTKAIKRFPDDMDLLYELATLSEKIGRPVEMERLLRKIIAHKPDYHHAYNALGYSLADRNIRLPEARQLIRKALEYAPGDPFITDSLGWVEFRSGNLRESLRLLQSAYEKRPDAEIAAHLGEVLWALSQHDQARSVWREGLALNADNETLLQTLKRLGVTP